MDCTGSFLKTLTIITGAMMATMTMAPAAFGFCGFYVAKADTKLFNQASKVVLVRDEERTVVTMVNDYQGNLKEFALVVPVPEVLKRKQINVGSNKTVEHLDAYTAPRLVEYFDPNPCAMAKKRSLVMEDAVMPPMSEAGSSSGQAAHGVKVEAEYQVGEYDILILSATESSGLLTWLKTNGYQLPAGALGTLKSYISRDLKFFVAKVNLKRQAKEGFSFLRPIQLAYETERFELPIRLGTVNANGPQDLFVFALTRTGKVETYNYRTVKLPTDRELPPYVKDDFSNFYQEMFSQQVKKDDMRVVYQEYAWDMSWCDPCAADPLSADELRELGVFWVPKAGEVEQSGPGTRRIPPGPPSTSGQNVFVTRLHVRYDGKTFPDDIRFQVTNDRQNFQGRYILRHPYTGEEKCAAMDQYQEALRQRQEKEAQTLASLTGWDIKEIRQKIDIKPPRTEDKRDDDDWIDNIWK